MNNELLLNKFISDLSVASGLPEINELFLDFVRSLGFDYSVYIVLTAPGVTPDEIMNLILGNHPPEWNNYYTENGYTSFDRTFVEAFRSNLPIIWDDLVQNGNLTIKEKQVFSDAAKFGVKFGISFPIHGPSGELAYVTASSSNDDEKTKKHLLEQKHTVHVATQYLHERIRDMGYLKEFFERINPTDREKECIYWAARGKTAWETAQILGISENTVNTHIKSIMAKLNVSNRMELIAKSVAYRIILPYDPDSVDVKSPHLQRSSVTS